MTILSMIVAHADNRVIGKDNDMPWHLPADLAYFKRTTLGKPIIMGRKTYESIGRPLPGRKNIVISRDEGYRAEGVEVVGSVEAALALVSDVEEVMVIGGASLCEQLLPKVNRLYITKIDAEFEGDIYFPKYDAPRWRQISSESHPKDISNIYPYQFIVLERIS